MHQGVHTWCPPRRAGWRARAKPDAKQVQPGTPAVVLQPCGKSRRMQELQRGAGTRMVLLGRGMGQQGTQNSKTLLHSWLKALYI